MCIYSESGSLTNTMGNLTTRRLCNTTSAPLGRTPAVIWGPLQPRGSPVVGVLGVWALCNIGTLQRQGCSAQNERHLPPTGQGLTWIDVDTLQHLVFLIESGRHFAHRCMVHSAASLLFNSWCQKQNEQI